MAMPKGEVEQGSFHVDQTVEIDATRDAVWACLLDVAGWWCHCSSEKRGALSLEPRAGGLFQERLPGGGGSLWGVVTQVEPPALLRLEGPLGMDTPVVSVYEYTLKAKGRKTALRLVHRVFGVLDPAWAKAYDEGWKELWVHLKALAEKGKRYAP